MHKPTAGVTYFLLTITILLAYLPVTSFLFAVKNDFFTGYFPPKFFLSESLREGLVPLWNPYINYGIPAYGDMSGGYWNPVSWLVALTTGYNAYSFTLELVSYLIISAWGMFRLCKYLKLQTETSIIAAISYGCCGYFIGNLQHFNWVTGAALIPWCMLSLLSLLDDFSVKKLNIAVLFFFLFLTSAHPGLMIGAAYFFFFVAVAHIQSGVSHSQFPILKKINYLFIFLICISLACLGMFYAYADTIPFLTRADKPVMQNGDTGSTTLQSWISLLLPLTTVKGNDFFNTDISMRNVYAGLFILTGFISGIFTKKTIWQKWLLVCIIFFILLAAGNFAGFAFKTLLPFTGYVRLDGEFRLFAMIALILFSALTLDKYIKADFPVTYKSILKGFMVLLISCFIIALIYKLTTRSGILFLNMPDNNPDISEKIKWILGHLTVSDCIILQGLIQIFFLILYIKATGNIKKPTLIFLTGTELVIATIIQLPFTGVGTKSVQDVQNFINRSPKGIPNPSLLPSVELVKNYPATDSLIGNWSLYSKEIAIEKIVPYPIVLKTSDSLFKNKSNQSTIQFPFIFSLPADSSSQIVLTEFAPGHIKINTDNLSNSQLIVKQNNYKYWQAYTNNIPVALTPAYLSFMSVALPAGNHHIEFRFKSREINTALIYHALVFLIILTTLLYFFFINSFWGNPKKR